MLDDLDRLRNNPHLLQLLTHYAEMGQENREVWQDRVMEMDDLKASDISKLHGDLIAFSWAEQNTGQVPCCYRITLNGLRAIRMINGEEISDELAEAPEKPRFPRKKREKAEAVPSPQADAA